jgi:pimeloyl-ACP methyl ester carboxylesterase
MTLSTFLRIGLALQLGIGTAVALFLLPDALEWLAIPIAFLVPLVGTAVVLAFEFALGAFADPRVPPLPKRELLAIWWEETRISTRMFSFAQLFASHFPELPLVHDPQRPAVLLVHGYLCNRAVWHALMDSGRLDGCNVATIDLEPIFGPLERYAAVIHSALEHLRASTGAAQVVLVGHSMGGLAIREYLRQFGDTNVAKIVTLATPHHGTIFAPLGSGANAKQMAVGSPFMSELGRALSPQLAAKFLCVATREDNLIVPRSSPLLTGSRHVVLDRVGHLALIEDRRAWEALENELHPQRSRLAA